MTGLLGTSVNTDPAYEVPLILLLWLASAAQAYEADTLTDRDDELPDVTEELDLRVQLVITEAIEHTNQRLGCDAEPDRAREVLARAIHARTAANELVADRGGLRALGFDRYSAWIEKGGVPHRAFIERTDLFASTTLVESPLLKWAGVCSAVKVNGVLVGTDKLDHFFEEGFIAWRKSSDGADLDRAIAWATHTENTKYGLETSNTFSFSDLRADYDGLHFYDSLLQPGSVAVLDAEGCITEGAPFTWRDWVTWEYDEVLNPPVYTPSTQRGVDRHLTLHQEAYCAEYAVWGGPDYEAHLEEVLSSTLEYAGPAAPERTDPYRLAERCASVPADEVDPARPQRAP